MATRQFPPSPPVLSHPSYPYQLPHPSHMAGQHRVTSPFSVASSFTAPTQPLPVPPTAPPTIELPSTMSLPFPWSPASQPAQPVRSPVSGLGAIAGLISPLEVSTGQVIGGAATTLKESFNNITLSPLTMSAPGTVCSAPALAAGTVIGIPGTGNVPGIPGLQRRNENPSPGATASEALQWLNVQSPGLSTSGFTPMGLSPIPGIVEKRQGQGEPLTAERTMTAEKVTNYLLGSATTPTVRPPGQVGQIATVEGVKRGYAQHDFAPRTGKRGEKGVENQLMEIHKAYQELVDRLHEDFRKERKLWSEERKLYELRLKGLEGKIAAQQPRPMAMAESSKEAEGRRETGQGASKWEPPPPMPLPPGPSHGLGSSGWAPTTTSHYHDHSQYHTQTFHSHDGSRTQYRPQNEGQETTSFGPYLASFPPYSERPSTEVHPPTTAQFGYSYSHPYSEHRPNISSYPRPPTREDVSKPSEKSKENQPSSRVSFTSPATTRSHSYPLSPESQDTLSESPTKEKRRKHTFPIPPPLSPVSPERGILNATNVQVREEKQEEGGDPEPILKSPASKAIDIISPIPVHKIDPLHISPSPAPVGNVSPSHAAEKRKEGQELGEKEEGEYSHREIVPAWRARSKSPAALSEAGKSESSEPEVRMILKKNNNFGAGAWGVRMPRLDGSGDADAGWGFAAEAGAGAGWKTPRGGFNDL